MGKAALFAIVAFGAMGAYYGLNTHRGMLDTSERIAEHQYEVMARNAALAGYNLARQELSESFTNFATMKKYDGSVFGVTVVVSGSDATITARGLSRAGKYQDSDLGMLVALLGYTSEDDDTEPVTYTITSHVKQESFFQMAEEPPAFMQYGLSTEKDLVLNGGVVIDTMRVSGAESVVYNANIHTNGKLTVKGNKANIRGFGSYVTSKDVQHDVFHPYHNPTNDPAVKQTTAIDIPAASFDPAALMAKVTPNKTTAGDLTLSGDYDFTAMGATRENPYIWYVKGKLTATGASLTGYVMFVTDGDIEFTGNVEVGTHQGPGENNYAFYSGEDVEIGGNAKALYGQIFAKRDVFFHGTPKIVGTVTAGGEAKVSGTPDLYYLPASPALTTIWQDPETRLKLVAYSELTE